jgi:tetratricopeptide (TPR) repeat protein
MAGVVKPRRTDGKGIANRLMGFWRILIFILIGLSLATPAEAQKRRRGFPETPSPQGQALFELRSGFQRLSTGDTKGAVAFLSRAIESEALPAHAAGSAYFFRGAAYREQSKFRESLSDLDHAARLTPDKGQIPVLAFDVALRMDQPVTAFDKAMVVAKSFPKEVGSLDLSALLAVMASLEKGRRFDDTHKLRAALFEAEYQGSPIGETADYMFKELVAGYLRRDDLVNAIRVSTAINTVDVIISLLVDKRFEELWPSIESGIGGSFTKAASRQLNRYTEIVKELPEDGQAVNMLVDSLRMSGQPFPAIQVGNRMLEDPVSIGRDPEAYFWVMIKTAYAEVESDRASDAIKRLNDLKTYKLDDYPDLVNHHLNRAALLLDLGRFDEAVTAAKLAEGRYLSLYGRLWVRTFEACRDAEAKDVLGLTAALDQLRDKAYDNPSAYALALLCAGKQADAEAWYSRRLSDEALREDALRALQIYKTGPYEPVFFSQMQQRLDAIRKKGSIRRAISKAGRQIKIDLPRGSFASY